jgi:hypothetical protein
VSGNTLLHVAAYHDQREVAAAILASCPALVHVRNHKFDSTPLDCAMHKGLAEMVCDLSCPVLEEARQPLLVCVPLIDHELAMQTELLTGGLKLSDPRPSPPVGSGEA